MHTRADALDTPTKKWQLHVHASLLCHEIVGNAYPLESTVWDGCVFACFDTPLQFACILLVVLLGIVVARVKLLRR